MQRVADIAEKQQAAVSQRQLAGAGLTSVDIRRWLSSERILRTGTRNVYRMPGAERTWKQALWLAILGGPEGAVVSHLSAAALWGLVRPPDVPHVTVGRRSSGRFQGAVIHHATVTSIDRCRFQRFPAQERAGRVRGGGQLRAALAHYAGGARPRSEKEAHMLRLFHSWGLPAPETQHVIRDERGRFIAKVDFAWVPWRFGLEYDGDEFHPPRRWAHDDRRQARIERTGWRIERADREDTRPSSSRVRALLTDVLLHSFRSAA